MIADLPCSGLGVLAKKTDLKYKATEQGTKELAGLQREILKNAAECGIAGCPQRRYRLRDIFKGECVIKGETNL